MVLEARELTVQIPLLVVAKLVAQFVQIIVNLLKESVSVQLLQLSRQGMHWVGPDFENRATVPAEQFMDAGMTQVALRFRT